MKTSLTHLLKKATLAVCVATALTAQALSATELTVYTAVESDDLQKYAERFNQAHPDISICVNR